MNLSNLDIKNAWKILIKPERVDYSLDNLGPKLTCFKNKDSFRKDFQFTNTRNNQIECSLFIPIKPNSPITNHESLLLNAPCVIYCHSQSEFCIENGYGLCAFDFNSCGKSKGEYVTLGWREQDDLEQLIHILTREYQANQISVWGRSMGAVTAILFAERNSIYLSSMILDSPFSDINVMVQDIAYEFMKLPGFIVKLALKYMSSKIEQKLDFNILKLKPIKFVKNCTVPCIFIVGEEDKLVLPKRGKEIFEAYKGKLKSMLISKGDHSAERESEILNQSFNLIYKEFKKNSYQPRLMQNPRPNYANQIPDNFLGQLAQQFDQKIQYNIQNSNLKKNYDNRYYLSADVQTFNFDYVADDQDDSQKKSFYDEQQYLNYRNNKKKTGLGNILDKEYKQEGYTQDKLQQNLFDLSQVMNKEFRRQKF